MLSPRNFLYREIKKKCSSIKDRGVQNFRTASLDGKGQIIQEIILLIVEVLIFEQRLYLLNPVLSVLNELDHSLFIVIHEMCSIVTVTFTNQETIIDWI